MEKQTKRNNMSKEDERVLIEEKTYRLQGARPKARDTQGLPAIRPNSNGEKQRKSASPSSEERHFQGNETRLSKTKGNQNSPQEIISVDNMSLVTARQGVNKLPYYRTNSAPLPEPRTPFRIFLPVSPSRRTPHSAPAQMLSDFQWPSPRPQQQSMAKNHVASESTQNSLVGMTGSKKKEVVHFPYIKPQRHGARTSTQSHLYQCKAQPRNRINNEEIKELDKRQEDEVTRRRSALESRGGARGGLLERPKLERSRLHPVPSPSSRMLETRNASARQIKGQEILTVKNTMEENYPSTASFPLRNGVKSKEEEEKFHERNIRQHADLMMLRMQQGNEREMKAANTTGERNGFLYHGEMNDNVQVGDKKMQTNAPKQERRKRLCARADSNGTHTVSHEQVLHSRLEEVQFEEVFMLPAPDIGLRTPEVVSRPLQNATNFPKSAARKTRNHTSETISVSSNVTVISENESKHDMPNGIGQRNISPVSFVSQLIADSQKLTLNDSVESPSLKEKKKLARILRKKFD